MNLARWTILAALMLVWQSASADDAAERARIASERRAADAAFAERERDCRQRFAVTACIDAARAEQRAVRERLRREEGVLDAAQRRQRAAERVDAIRNRVSEEEARQRAAAARQSPEVTIRSAPPSAGTRRGPAASAPAGETTAERQAREALARERFEGRQREAQKHRDAVERRAAERASGAKPAASALPTPR